MCVWSGCVACPRCAQAAPEHVEARRSAAAREGIALLKRGASALKYSRSGKPRATLFRLSPQEHELSWEGAGLSKLVVKHERRAVEISEISAISVGRQSDAFRRSSGGEASPGAAHLSFSLHLNGADAMAERSERGTLDLSFEDEVEFGLWLAALRALMAEARGDEDGILGNTHAAGATTGAGACAATCEHGEACVAAPQGGADATPFDTSFS
eukprot:3583217-Pleurochrysis_carterae.AAC.4